MKCYIDDVTHDRFPILVLKRSPPDEQLVSEDSHAPHIYAFVVFFSFDDLGGCVVKSTTKGGSISLHDG